VQAFAVIAAFCLGMLLVPSLTTSIFSGRGGESLLPTVVHMPRLPQRGPGRK
jgi:hypothetical protein